MSHNDLPLFAFGETQGNSATPSALPELPSAPPINAPESGIADFGEKIGGARKDLAAEKRLRQAQSGNQPKAANPKRERSPEEIERPWIRYYTTRKDSTSVVLVRKDHGVARFATEEAAIAGIDTMEFKLTHGITRETGDTFGICRRLGDHKRPIIKGGFATQLDAEKYISENRIAILKHRFPEPERPWLDSMTRTGPELRSGNVSPLQFQEAFGFRGGEFGNWNMGGDGQAALNHAFDALHDLARALRIHPRDLSLDGTLAIAFGARGHGGKQSARAHYEPDYKVMNLTKIYGAGCLAHEWFHALDNFIGARGAQCDEARRTYATSHKGPWQTAPVEALKEWQTLVHRLRRQPKEVPVDIDRKSASLNYKKADIRYQLQNLRQSLSYGAKPGTTDAQKQSYAEICNRIESGDLGRRTHFRPNASARSNSLGYASCEAVDELDALHKQITGRSLLKADPICCGYRLVQTAFAIEKESLELEQTPANATRQAEYPTNFYQDAKYCDEFRVGDYFTLPVELAARAFEGFVSDSLKESGQRSDYLVYGAENCWYPAKLKPYPEGDERLRFNAMFRSLIDVTIETQCLRRHPDLHAESLPSEEIEARPSLTT